jgi:hypothetical protein
MKVCIAAFTGILLTAMELNGQGSYVYDQQSATESTGGGSPIIFQSNQPYGQSFTPTLSSVGFIRLATADASLNSMGVTLVVNLRDVSINGTILGTSDPVSMPDGFAGYANFFFSTPVSTTPGTQYYFQPSLVTGDASWTIRSYNGYGYSGGTAYANDVVSPGFDLWFREGIIVPEPSSGALLMLGLCAIAARRRWSS